MMESDVKILLEAIGSAEWRLNLYQFCEKLEVEQDDYWQDKFLEFKELARFAGRFDAHTLCKIIG